MSSSKIETVSDYLNSLAPDRKKALSAIRKVVRKNLPKGLKETLSWRMITYEVPLKVYPETYNKRPLVYAGIASQRNHMAVYLMCLNANTKVEKAFRAHFAKSGKKLDLGKSCVRFKKLEDLDLEAVGKAISSLTMTEFIALYEKVHGR